MGDILASTLRPDDGGDYEDDVLAWSERQADLLRGINAGQWPDERPDWQHIAEEIADVGLSELHTVQSHLIKATEHLLKISAWPYAPAVGKWREEAYIQRPNSVTVPA